jgi:tetratricopeptide (TPR) repeat protein
MYVCANSAMLKSSQQSYLEAIALYTEALSKDPDAALWNAVLLANRAAAYMNTGKFREAVVDCDKSLQLDSGNSLASSECKRNRDLSQQTYPSY